MIWLGILMVGLLVALLAWWLLIKTEGVYLGRGVVIWLYDVYASRYDNIKQFDPETEDYFLARPLLQRLNHVRAPLILDVASGTGRLPLALFEQTTFQGRIVGVDLSRKMLHIAAEKLVPHAPRVTLLHGPAEQLPFSDGTFDCVTCLEALEFMMHPKDVLRELIRVLRPGGLLVLTNRQGADAKMMPGKTFTHGELRRLLRDDLGLERVEIQVWQVDYRIVWALKPGHSDPSGPRALEEIWRCPRCGQIALHRDGDDDSYGCGACGQPVRVGADGVIEGVTAKK